jgi:hypothetical protein
MKTTLETINHMQADGVIGLYAIGGAVAATLDVDIFVRLPAMPGSFLLSLSPIYEYLTARGHHVEREYIVIGNWPVQFLAPSSELELEAISQARETEVEGVRTRVMTAEHLVAIALQTGRAKDHARIVQFLEQDAVDRDKLRQVLASHELVPKWEQFERKYLEGPHE